MCDYHSTLQYRRPIHAENVMVSPTLVKSEMRNVYLGPNMNATNATAMNGHVMAAF